MIYVTPSHQFPLGVPMSLPRRLALLRWAAEARAWIVEDDYDSEFRYGTRPIPCLHGLDGDGRVIYVGTFSKHLMPALRLGFLILPADLRERVLQVRRTAELHPQTIDQLALADLMREGHYDRHLRRLRAICEERLRAFEEAAERYCGGLLRVRPVHTGLHAVADLEAADADRVFEEAAARGVEVMPLSSYYADRRKAPNALVLSFAASPPAVLADGMRRLAAAIEAATRSQRARRRA
jgi:GntR family transcriptional regulator / MocR family aminotransferase